MWTRHILDCIQIIRYLPKKKKGMFLLDVGTGAGFPGVVLHIMGRKMFYFVIKAQKSFFLKKILQECSLDIEVYNNKVEKYFKKYRCYSFKSIFFFK